MTADAEGTGVSTVPESAARFWQIIEKIPQVFYVTDAERRIVYVSPAFESLWGYSLDRLYGNPFVWLELVHPDDRQLIYDAIAQNAGKGPYEVEYRVKRADGVTRWISSRSTEIYDEAGALQHVVGVATDITDRRDLERQLHQSQKMEAVGQLAGGIAHDFNNLLMVILANAAMLRKQLDAHDTRTQRVIDIEDAATSAVHLTKKLLGFARPAVLNLAPIDLRDSVSEMVGIIRRTFDPRIVVEVEQTEAPALVLADANEISHTLMNLCLNARDAMPEGGRLVVSVGRTIIDAAHVGETSDARVGDFVFVSVADTGRGIPREVLPRIFEPFFTTKPAGTGSGLGLAVAFGMVKQHKGWIECATSDSGTKFTVYLPPH